MASTGHHTGSKAGQHGQYDPAGLAERRGQDQDQKAQHANTEGHEVVPDKGDRVGHNHRDSAQIQFCLFPMSIHDAPDSGDLFILLVLQSGTVSIELL